MDTTNIMAGEALAQSLAPIGGPNAILAIGMATTLLNAALKATASGKDITDAELVALFSADDAAKADDAEAQKAAA